jgi:hypothetical protein
VPKYLHLRCLLLAALPLPAVHCLLLLLQEVYAEDMVHRNPADASTLSTTEHPFSVAHAWVAAEGEDVDEGGAGPTFTRVVIGDLKPDVLRQIMDDEQGTYICQVG